MKKLLRESGMVGRRALLQSSLAAAAVISLPYLVRRATAQSLSGFDPFPFSVASGDPTQDAVVIWTRLARAVNEPTPVAAGPVAVEWVLATDPTMTNILRQGVAMAQPEYGFSVHVDVQGLAPDCHYWYNFRVGGSASPIGRTRTLPAAETASSRFRFNVVSCQHWENGYFDAYDGMKDDEASFVLHLGDYIYGVGR